MKRIRNLGLAAVLALALTATLGVFSTSASAASFVADEYPAQVSGADANQKFWIKPGSDLNPSCLTEEPGHAFSFVSNWLEEASEMLTTAEIEDGIYCGSGSFWGEKAWELKMNGCQFSFNAAGSFSVGPETCGPVQLTNELEICKFSFAPSAFDEGFVFSYEEEKGSIVRIRLRDEKVPYTVTKGAWCGYQQGAGSGVARYQGEWLDVAAVNEVGEPISFNIE